MLKHHYLIAIGCVFSLYIFSGNVSANSRADSTGIKELDGKIYIVHQVEANETWYALSRKYDVKLERLMNFNGDKVLKTGDVVLVPADISKENLETGDISIEKAKMELPDLKKTPVYYRVKAKETLFSIAQRFNKSVFALREWNELEEDELQQGQQLIVNYIVDYKENNDVNISEKSIDSDLNKEVAIAEPTPDVKQVQEVVPFVATEETPKVTIEQLKEEKSKKKKKRKNKTKPAPPEIPKKLSKKDIEGLEATKTVSELKSDDSQKVIKKYVETGIGAYLAEGNLNQSRYYALHRTAPKGTIIKVTNTMNGSYVYVKVVGKLPETGDNHNQIIKITEAAAKKMGVLDTYFRATLTYGVAE